MIEVTKVGGAPLAQYLLELKSKMERSDT